MINYFILQLTMINVLLILNFILLPQIKQNNLLSVPFEVHIKWGHQNLTLDCEVGLEMKEKNSHLHGIQLLIY